jgi:hypothetical protein
MCCYHISVVLPNRPGELGRVSAVLSKGRVNILGHQLASQGNSSIVHLLCDPHQTAFEILKRQYRFYCNQKKVLVIRADHVPGELSRMLDCLAEQDLNLESSYQAILFKRDMSILIVLELKDREATERAEEILIEAGFDVSKEQPSASPTPFVDRSEPTHLGI